MVARRRLPPRRPGTRRRSRRRWPRCASGATRRSPPGSRPSARPSRTPRTSGPGAARRGSCSRRRAAAGCAVGGARFSAKHANFVENVGEASTADVLALMAEGRRRVHERFGVELEPEVQVLGDVELARRLGVVKRAALAPCPRARRARRRLSVRRPRRRRSRRRSPDRAGGGDRDRIRRGRGRPATGQVLAWLPAAGGRSLPRLPLAEPPRAGPARRAGAAAGAGPGRRAGQPCGPTSSGSFYGESGVDVELRSGIELRFGDASRRRGEVERGRGGARRSGDRRALDYVDLLAPGAPAIGGSGHTLPAVP